MGEIVQKFTSVDLLSAMRGIRNQCAGLYDRRDSAEISTKIFQAAIGTERNAAEAKRHIWFSCVPDNAKVEGLHAEWLLEEERLFIANSPEWRIFVSRGNGSVYPQAQALRDPFEVFAYKIIVRGITDSIVIGDIFELNYQEYADYISDACLPGKVQLVFEHETQVVAPEYMEEILMRQEYRNPFFQSQMGIFLESVWQIEDMAALQQLLTERRNMEERAPEGTFEKHISDLHCSMLDYCLRAFEESSQVVIEKFLQAEDQGTNDQKYAVIPMAPTFSILASEEDLLTVSSKLPYAGVEITRAMNLPPKVSLPSGVALDEYVALIPAEEILRESNGRR